MCGIAGAFYFDGSTARVEIIQRMTEVLAHRGPDGSGSYMSGSLGLGHQRLSIIDLSPKGQQPMSNEDQTVWIVFNGEIYNFVELRHQLESRGHQFRSSTDTETILHAYEEWGIECIQRFNGMFAFALWDEREHILWLARDRLGIKPLFFLHSSQYLLFGSEIKAILQHPGVKRVIDYQALAYYVALNYVPAPYTLFAGIRQLEPGHYLSVNISGQSQDVEYWDLVFQEDRKKLPNKIYLEKFNSLLADSVKLRLVSDVPFGAFLSGGVDSGTTTYWMSQHLEKPVRTFTIGFDEPSYDELTYARKVAQAVDAEHHERLVDADNAEIISKLVWHSEEPTADSSMVAIYYLAQFAREKVKMVLSGDGADEMLAGYETYQAYYIQHFYRYIPAWINRNLIIPLLNRFPANDSKVSWDYKARQFVRYGGLNPEDAHATRRMIFDAADRRQLFAPVRHQPDHDADVIDLYRAAFKRTNAHHSLNRMLYVDTCFYLPNDMLVKVDRMAMAHGLEVRVPFLDHRLVEFAASVPPNLKLRNLWHKKYLLKASMAGKLPKDVIWRKKAGFNVPNARWIKKNFKPFVLDHLSTQRIQAMGIFNPTVVDNLLKDHFEERADNSHKIWCLLTLVLWYQHFFEENTQ